MEAPVTWTPTPTCLSVSKSLLNGWRKVGGGVMFSTLIHTVTVLFSFKWRLCAPEQPCFRSPRDIISLLEEQNKIDVFLWKKILKLKEGLMSLCGGHGTAGAWVPVHHFMLCDTSLWLKDFRQIKNGFKTPSKPAILNISHCSSLQLRADVRPLWHSSVVGFRSLLSKKKKLRYVSMVERARKFDSKNLKQTKALLAVARKSLWKPTHSTAHRLIPPQL